jgi:hypothetical protein
VIAQWTDRSISRVPDGPEMIDATLRRDTAFEYACVLPAGTRDVYIAGAKTFERLGLDAEGFSITKYRVEYFILF